MRCKNSLGFWDTKRSPNLSQKTRTRDNLQKKRTPQIVVFAIPADERAKIKKAKKEMSTIKKMELAGDSDTYCNWCFWNNPQRLCKGTGRLRNQRMRGEHSDYSLIMIGQNTE